MPYLWISASSSTDCAHEPLPSVGSGRRTALGQPVVPDEYSISDPSDRGGASPAAANASSYDCQPAKRPPTAICTSTPALARRRCAPRSAVDASTNTALASESSIT